MLRCICLCLLITAQTCRAQQLHEAMPSLKAGLLMDSLTDPQVLRADPAATQAALSVFSSPAPITVTGSTVATTSNAGISVLAIPTSLDAMTAIAPASRAEPGLPPALAAPPATTSPTEALPAALPAVPDKVQETITCYTSTGSAVAGEDMVASLSLPTKAAAAAAAVVKVPYLKSISGDSAVCVRYQYQCSRDLPTEAQLACSLEETDTNQWKYMYVSCQSCIETSPDWCTFSANGNFSRLFELHSTMPCAIFA
jgi:hypothetical protein